MDAPRFQKAGLFDRRAWILHRDRAARQGTVDFLHAEIASRLLDRLLDVGRAFPRALDLGARSGALARALEERAPFVVTAEPSQAFLAVAGGLRVAADPEFLPFAEGSFDLVLSNLLLHWADDLPGALIQLRRALAPDGLLLCSLLGGRTLFELREVLLEAEVLAEGGASPHLSPFAELADAAGLLLRAGFAMPVADSERITVSYRDLLSLLRDLRGMGETNALLARRKTPLKRAVLARAEALYRERFLEPSGRIRASFEILFLAGWAPHPSQPKPLRPGSARYRLSEALGTKEIPAGEPLPRRR